MARADNVVTINFRASGDKTLRQAINNLNTAIRNLEGKTESLGETNDNLRNKNRGLNQSFATLRSNMLLYQFAMGLGIRQLSQFAGQAAKIEVMETAFNNLSGGSLNASQTMEALQEATNGTMNRFDLFQQANNAMILGVAKNSDEMAKMFDTAQRLGAALGKDTRQSVESLITGIGRQSRLMLDNIGIIVKTEDAYKRYAAELKKNVDALTDSERKQAFLNATLEAAEEKLGRAGAEVLSADMQLQAFSVSTEELTLRMGEAFLPVLLKVTNELKEFIDTLDVETIKSYGTGLGVAVVLIGSYKTAVIAADAAQRVFTKGLAKTPWGAIAFGIATATGALLDYLDVYAEVDPELKNNIENIKKQVEVDEELRESIRKNTEKLRERLELLNSESDFQKELIKLGRIATIEEIKLIRQIIQKTNQKKAEAEAEKQLKKSTEERLQVEKEEIALNEKIFSIGEEAEQLRLKIQGKDKELELMKVELNLKKQLKEQDLILFEDGSINVILGEMTDQQIQYAQALREVADLQNILIEQKFADELIKNSNATKLGSEAMDIFTNNLVRGVQEGENFKDILESIKISFINLAKEMAVKSAIFSIFSALAPGVTAGMSLGSFLFGGVAHTGGLIQNNRIQKFANGGVVQGEDNVPILAQNGEFVMSRSAVESVGIETMNRINQTGNAGVTVNVTGNVMSQDYVEGELAELISEAVRKGTNYGL